MPYHKGSNYKLYNGRRWRNHSCRFRTVCAICQAEGRLVDITPSSKNRGVVDHTVPINMGGAIWDEDNHMGICGYHHDVKRGLESHGYCVSTTEGLDGLIPLDRNEIIDKLTGVADATDEWIASNHKRPGWEGA